MQKINFDQFCSRTMGGESRNRHGVGVGYVLVLDDSGNDDFYAEWAYNNDTAEEDQDERHLLLAYNAYIAGDSEYIA